MGKLYLHYLFLTVTSVTWKNMVTFTQLQPVLRCNVRLRKTWTGGNRIFEFFEGHL